MTIERVPVCDLCKSREQRTFSSVRAFERQKG